MDLGPNIVAYKRIDRMLDELQRSLGTSEVLAEVAPFQKSNTYPYLLNCYRFADSAEAVEAERCELQR